MLYFEKKNQKIYVEPGGAQAAGKSARLLHPIFLSAARLNLLFLLLFFKKQNLPSS
jgi:hypothetical protein